METIELVAPDLPPIFDGSLSGMIVQVKRSMRFLASEYAKEKNVEFRKRIDAAFLKLHGELIELTREEQNVPTAI